MMGSCKSLIIFFLSLYVAEGALKFDICEHPPIMKDFDYRKMVGRWYEFARLPNFFQYFVEQRCNTQYMTLTNYGLHFNGSMIEKYSGYHLTYNGEITPVPKQPGTVRVYIKTVGIEDNMNIIDAKYDDYVILHQCKQIGIFRFAIAWILTRERELSKEKQERLIKIIRAKRIVYNIELEDQKKCY